MERMIGNLSHRFAVRNRLDCRPFRWYVENIYPELQMADGGAAVLASALARPYWSFSAKFRLQHAASGLCLAAVESAATTDSDDNYAKRKKGKGKEMKNSFGVALDECSRILGTQLWYETPEVGSISFSRKWCLDGHAAAAAAAAKPTGNAQPLPIAKLLSKCTFLGGSQTWKYSLDSGDAQTTEFYNPGAGLCLGYDVALRDRRVELMRCKQETERKGGQLAGPTQWRILHRL